MVQWLDRLPSRKRQKIQERLRSPAEYEKLRERVKGPEDLERELKRMERMAEMRFRLETEPRFHEELKERVRDYLKEKGIEQMLEDSDVAPNIKAALESGRFALSIEENLETHEDEFIVLPEGNVTEKLSIKPQVTETYLRDL